MGGRGDGTKQKGGRGGGGRVRSGSTYKFIPIQSPPGTAGASKRNTVHEVNERVLEIRKQIARTMYGPNSRKIETVDVKESAVETVARPSSPGSISENVVLETATQSSLLFKPLAVAAERERERSPTPPQTRAMLEWIPPWKKEEAEEEEAQRVDAAAMHGAGPVQADDAEAVETAETAQNETAETMDTSNYTLDLLGNLILHDSHPDITNSEKEGASSFARPAVSRLDVGDLSMVNRDNTIDNREADEDDSVPTDFTLEEPVNFSMGGIAMSISDLARQESHHSVGGASGYDAGPDEEGRELEGSQSEDPMKSVSQSPPETTARSILESSLKLWPSKSQLGKPTRSVPPSNTNAPANSIINSTDRQHGHHNAPAISNTITARSSSNTTDTEGSPNPRAVWKSYKAHSVADLGPVVREISESRPVEVSRKSYSSPSTPVPDAISASSLLKLKEELMAMESSDPSAMTLPIAGSSGVDWEGGEEDHSDGDKVAPLVDFAAFALPRGPNDASLNPSTMSCSTDSQWNRLLEDPSTAGVTETMRQFQTLEERLEASKAELDFVQGELEFEQEKLKRLASMLQLLLNDMMRDFQKPTQAFVRRVQDIVYHTIETGRQEANERSGQLQNPNEPVPTEPTDLGKFTFMVTPPTPPLSELPEQRKTTSAKSNLRHVGGDDDTTQDMSEREDTISLVERLLPETIQPHSPPRPSTPVDSSYGIFTAPTSVVHASTQYEPPNSDQSVEFAECQTDEECALVSSTPAVKESTNSEARGTEREEQGVDVYRTTTSLPAAPIDTKAIVDAVVGEIKGDLAKAASSKTDLANVLQLVSDVKQSISELGEKIAIPTISRRDSVSMKELPEEKRGKRQEEYVRLQSSMKAAVDKLTEKAEEIESIQDSIKDLRDMVSLETKSSRSATDKVRDVVSDLYTLLEHQEERQLIQQEKDGKRDSTSTPPRSPRTPPLRRRLSDRSLSDHPGTRHLDVTELTGVSMALHALTEEGAKAASETKARAKIEQDYLDLERPYEIACEECMKKRIRVEEKTDKEVVDETDILLMQARAFELSIDQEVMQTLKRVSTVTAATSPGTALKFFNPMKGLVRAVPAWTPTPTGDKDGDKARLHWTPSPTSDVQSPIPRMTSPLSPTR